MVAARRVGPAAAVGGGIARRRGGTVGARGARLRAARAAAREAALLEAQEENANLRRRTEQLEAQLNGEEYGEEDEEDY